METTLGEQLLLLSLDDKSGVAREPANVAAAIAGASLVGSQSQAGSPWTAISFR